MNLARSFPLLGIILVLYTLFAFAEFYSGTPWFESYVVFPLPDGAAMAFTLEDGLVLSGLVLLFIELVKATNASNISIFEHIMSTFVLIIFLGELLIFPHQMGRAPFVFLTTMALVDVIAGITISVTAARKDLTIG